MAALKILKLLAVIVFGIVVTLGGIGMILRVIEKVQSGHGLDYFFDVDGVQWNYIGLLILLALLPIALLIGWALRMWQLRDERDFKKRYRIKE